MGSLPTLPFDIPKPRPLRRGFVFLFGQMGGWWANCTPYACFDNYQEYPGLYGLERILRELPMPRIASARLIPQSIKDQLGYIADVVFKRSA